jgi:hypothetical protein
MYRTTTGLISALLLLAEIGGSSALAQGTMAQQDACRPDVFRLCGNYIPDVGQIVACLRGNESRLSEPCHEVMFERSAAPEDYAVRTRARSNWDR